MSDFHLFAQKIGERFAQMSEGELHTTGVEETEGDNRPTLFEVYLDSFPHGTNPMFRVRTEHDCSCCRNFIKHLGGVVAINRHNNTRSLTTVWDDYLDMPYPYNVVARKMADHVRGKGITGIFRTKEQSYGTRETHERDATTHELKFVWQHLHAPVAARHRHDEPQQIIGKVATNVGVFKRSLDTITSDAIGTITDLIDSNSLYRGAEHMHHVRSFKQHQRRYDELQGLPNQQNIFAWSHATTAGGYPNNGIMFRSTVIGTLAVDLSEGMDIEDAVKLFESKVAPQNYKRTTALITPRIIEKALKDLDGLGLANAVHRRIACLEDISVNDVLFVDNDTRSKLRPSGSLSDAAMRLFDTLAPSVPPVIPKQAQITAAPTISIDALIGQLLPQALAVDVLVTNEHANRFMTLTMEKYKAGEQPSPLFAWGNDFAWSYDGDVADSIRQRVKRAGGKIDGYARISLAWSNTDDLDLHLRSDFDHIYYGNKRRGNIALDVDMNVSNVVRDPVENIVFENRFRDGEYLVYVNQFTKREDVDVGFTLEFEREGQLTTLTYDKAVRLNENVECLRFIVDKGIVRSMKIGSQMKTTTSSLTKWGVQTQSFVPVHCILNSPNYWANARPSGNKHTFFILKGCNNPDTVRGFYNEYLHPALAPHRKVFEVLGSKMKADPLPQGSDELSGVGFSSTTGALSDTTLTTRVTTRNNVQSLYNVKF